MFNNEKYYLQDSQHDTGYLVYSHVGFENTTNIYKVKCITVTVSTGGWVLTEEKIKEKNIFDGTVSRTGVGTYSTTIND